MFRSTLRGAVAASLVTCVALAGTVGPASAADDTQSSDHEAATQAQLDRLYRTAALLPDEYLDQLPTTAAEAGLDFAPMMLKVIADRDERGMLAASGLDVTEHAGHDYIEVVINSQEELDYLDGLDMPYEVVEADLINLEYRRIMADAAFARANALTELPSGRTTYRVLADYKVEIDQLVADNPNVAKAISLGQSYEGRELDGIEIGVDVNAPEDGRPVLLMFGNHHAREWPSAETPMEFAYDLLNNFNDGDARTVDLLKRSRVIIVPVSNPDGYEASRTSGDLLDLNVLDGGGTVSILATPGNAYKRKNCNNFTGQPNPPFFCTTNSSPGGQGIGIDLNRNYGGLWGGPGAVGDNPDASQSINGAGRLSAIYRGPAPFSEPETQAIRTLISTRQVTTLISNHTFSNLLLRPVGVSPATVGPDGFPIGYAPDECFTTAAGNDYGMQALGEQMTAQTGYSNQFGWELYDTTGTTEDYSYNATGGYGYTFEIGPDEFHPPFENVVNEYIGNTAPAQAMTAENAPDLTSGVARECGGTAVTHDTVGGGLSGAYYIALENAANAETHSVLTGEAPAGAVIGVTRTGTFPLWDNTPFEDTVATSMTVPAGDTFEYHVNASTRPFVASRPYSQADLSLPPYDETSRTTHTGSAAEALPNKAIEIEIADGIDALILQLSADAPNDYDLELYGPDGEQIATSGAADSAETISLVRPDGLTPGTYVARVVNFSAIGPWSLDVALGTVDGSTTTAPLEFTPASVEKWTVTCTIDDVLINTREVQVDRGVSKNLGEFCAVAAAGTVDPATDPTTQPATNPDVQAGGESKTDPLAATGGGAATLALLALAAAGRLSRREDGTDVAA